MRGTQFAQLTAFVAVAEHNSFTKAARHLGISKPFVSQIIRSLEEQLGVRLLDRTTRSVALTEAGEKLLARLHPAIEGLHSALDTIDALRDKPVGKLRISVHPVAAVTMIAPLVARFAAKYPEIFLDISVDREPKDIVNERFDVGIIPGDGVPGDMVAIPIGGKFRLNTVASPEYLDRNVPLSMPHDLTQHNCIRYCWTDDKADHLWKFESPGQKIEVKVTGSLKVNNLDLALRAALDGVGIVQLPESSAAPFITEGKLAPVLPAWSPQWSDFVLFYSSRRHVPVKLRMLIDFLTAQSKQWAQADDSKLIDCSKLIRLTRRNDLRPAENFG
jgi:DNA-binding transcriptional LysR family regulator